MPVMPVVARLVSLALVLSLVSSFGVAAQPAEEDLLSNR